MFTQPEADLLVQTAVAALAEGHVDAAEASLNAALRAEPRHPMALTRLAEIVLRRKDHARATEQLNAALAIEPHFAPAWGQLSHALWLAGRCLDALAAARRAVAIQPSDPQLRLQLAQIAGWTGHRAEARQALAPLFQPGGCDQATHATAVSMQGELAIAAGRFDDANTHLRDALRRLPALNATRMMLGMNLLRLGSFAEGWVEYAARDNIAAFFPNGRMVPPGEAWQGQDLNGKTILIVDDQGHGDAIQFFRYLPLLKARGVRRITLRSFAPLVQLLRDAAPYATVLAALPDDAQFDYHCTSSSLPRWFATTPETIPSTLPYLRPPVHPRAVPKRHPTKRLQVGLAWSGDARHMRDHLRSIPADMFLGLTDIPGIRFHSLQKTVRPYDRPALEARPSIARDVEKALDFADTAALIARLDLVITVDTAIAHLAGALGKPVWILLHVSPDWRWLTDRADSPWYPTARLFRVAPAEWDADVGDPCPMQRSEGGWQPLLNRVAAALRTFTPTDQAGIIRPRERPPNR